MKDPNKSAGTKIKVGKQREMAKRKRLSFRKGKLCEVQSMDATSGSNRNVTHEEIATPRVITPSIHCGPIFVLEQASLKIGLVGKKRKILYAAEDAKFLLKKGNNLDDYRPDILYQALHEILDSRMNKVGGIEAVYVKTDFGLLFEVKTHARIPRTWKRFCGIMLDPLDKSCVHAKESGQVLLRVHEGPLTKHLPENVRILGFSYSSPKIVDIEDYLSPVNDDLSLVFVVGAMVKGKVNKDGMDDYLSEARALRDGVNATIQAVFNNVCIEGDDLIVIQALKGNIPIPWRISNITEDVRTWLHQTPRSIITDDVIGCTFIGRDV